MNGREKSGPVVVAANAPNKAGRPAAEARERRTGTEGKASQHGRHRALNRARVSQPLERLRQGARQKKKVRFTPLLHHVNLDSLREAFYALKRDAAPDVDGTMARIRGGPRAQARRPARPCSSRRVSPATLAPDVHAEGGWERAAAGNCRSGRQDRPGRHRHGAECDWGTGQGAVISPLLANICLHYVLDLWAERWRRREATGDMIIVRGACPRAARSAASGADDVVAGFEHEADARRFLEAMRARFEEFALSLHPDKTRLIEFGRHAATRRDQRGLGKPETFKFVGFYLHLRQIPPGPFPSQARPRALGAFRLHTIRLWRRVLRRRSQEDASRGNGSRSWPPTFFPSPEFSTPGPATASPSNIRGGSRMRESRTYGSVRWALSNGRP